MSWWGGLRRRRGTAPVWGFVLATVTLAIALVMVFRAYQAATWDLIHERDLQVAFLSAARLREELTRYGGELSALTRRPEIYAGTAAERRAALVGAASQLAVFDGGVVLVDHHGRVQASQPARSVVYGTDWSSREYFRLQIVSPRITVSDITTDDAPVGTQAVAVSVPMTDADGAFAGVLIGFFRIGESGASALYASIARLRTGEHAHTYIVDSRRNIIYDSAYVSAGGPLSGPGPEGLGDLARAGTLRTRDGAGNDILVAHTPVPGTRWALVIEDDWTQLTASVARYRQIMLGLLVLGIAIPLLGLAWTALRQRGAPGAGRPFRGAVDAAVAVHRLIGPVQLPMLPGWSLAGHQQPGDGRPRDFHDFRFRPDGCLIVAACRLPVDAAQAVGVMSLVRANLRAAARHGWGAAEAVSEIDALICADTDPGSAVAGLWLVLDPLSGQVTLVNAGFEPPRLVHLDGMEDLAACGPPLGATGAAPRAEHSVNLLPGECLVCHDLPTVALAAGDGHVLDAACAAFQHRDESAQYRLDDLVEMLRIRPQHHAAEAVGYQIILVARATDGVPGGGA